MSRFQSAIVLWIQTPFGGLCLVFQQQDLVDNGDCVAQLDLHQCSTHSFPDVGRVNGLAAQNDAQAEDCPGG
jgi:hypothetical protein